MAKMIDVKQLLAPPGPSPAQGPLFIFIGSPRHGKSTARKVFCELTGLRGGSCSDVIFVLLSRHLGVPEAELRLVDKEALRPKLIEFGDFLCGSTGKLSLIEPEPAAGAPDKTAKLYRGPSALVRTLFHAGYRVIDGVRRRLELQEVRDRMEWLGIPVVVFWVERPGEPVLKDNTELSKEDADVVLLNDGTPDDLRQKIQVWMNQFNPKA
jgi:hypothetical protein